MSTWIIYSRNNVEKYRVSDIEFHDVWMGEEYVTVNISSATPIDLEIGDYLIYRWLTYTIYSLPSALKKARSGSYGDAFRYDNIKLSARSTELTEIRFFDIVLNDNNIHYTSLPTFSFYAETVDDLLDRILANTNRSGETPWLIISYNYTRTMQRYPVGNPLRASAELLWEETFGTTHTDNPTNVSRDSEKKNVNISIDRQSVFDGLQHIKNSFGLNYITRERILIVGGEGVSAEHLFQYGKGNGLYEIERSADAEQQVVTKLFAYGSDKNIPTRYYADLGKSCFATVKQKWYFGNANYLQVRLYVDELDTSLFTRRSQDSPGSSTNPRYIVTLQIDNISVRGSYYKSIEEDKPMFHLYCDREDPNGSDTWEPDWSNAIAFANAVQGKSTPFSVYITDGVNKEKWPAEMTDYTTSFLPNNMAVNVLMLPGFPTYSLNELCRYRIVDILGGKKTCYDIRKTPDSPYNTFLEIEGEYPVAFSTDRLNPFVVSKNITDLGTKEGDIHFVEENDDNGLEEVYPSVEGMTENDVFNNGSNNRLDEVVACEVVTDDGKYRTDDPDYKFPNFHITIPNLGFDLRQTAEDSGGDVTISFTDGYCGGRDFKVHNIHENQDHTWDLEVERCPDDTLSLMFPYSDAASHGQTPISNEPYQIRQGDHYVLIGINITETSYIWGASIHALVKAIKWLLNNDYTRFTYLPKVDEIYMARQNDEAQASQGNIKSLHDTLKAGMLMSFLDTDLAIDGNIFIDSLTIKENGNNGIPSYEVVLRNDKQVGTLQRVQNQLNSLTSFVNNGGGGLTVSQVRSLITAYGGEQFISKLNDDTAQGFIRLLKGLQVGNDYGIDSDGKAILKSLQSSNYVSGLTGWNIDMNGNVEAETLHLRSALEVDELRINRQQAQEGDTIYAENDQIESVEEQYDEAQDITTYILTLKEKWEGYFTAQQYGNILRGKINTLAAKDAGVSDYTGQEYQASQQEDDGGNKYYTSFMQTIATHNTDPNLGVNQIRVVLFGDSEVPMTKNYPPCALMAIARWGCIDYSAEYEGTPKYNDVVRSIKRRQQSFMVLSSEGRIVKLNGVDSPILRNGNFGTSLGILPEFVQNYPVVHDRMIAGRDYLYAQGVVVGDFIKIDVEGNPVPTVVDCGEWIDGSRTEPLTIKVWDAQQQRYVDHVLTFPIPSSEYNNSSSLYIGHGIYFYNKFNALTQQYETHKVRHDGGTWQSLQSQPVIESGVAHYYPPKWNSPYWMLVDGNDNLTIEFVSTNGSSFYQGYVNTVITPHLFYGNVEIDADGTEIAAQYWSWTRETESGKTDADRNWDSRHTGTKVLTLVNEDMPTAWGRGNKAIFTCAVVINDGKSDVIVQNQVIA